jgi:hypothetical protein
VALWSAGVPPAISGVLTNYLGDITLALTFSISTVISGSVSTKFFPDGNSEPSGQLQGAASGTVTLSLTARLGSDAWISVEVRGAGATGVTGSLQFDLTCNGLTVGPTIEVGGLTTEVTAVAKAGETEAIGAGRSWKVFDPWKPFGDITPVCLFGTDKQ